MCCRCPASGTRPRSRSAAASAASGVRRHLHQVDVQVQQPGMLAAAGRPSAALQHRPGLDGVGDPAPAAPVAQVPQLPTASGSSARRRTARRRRGRRGERAVDVAPSPRRRPRSRPSSPRPRLGAPPGSAAPAPRSAPARPASPRPQRSGPRATASCARRRSLRRSRLVEELPRLVVVRAERVGDAPVGHRAARVGARRRARSSATASSWLKAYDHTRPRSNHVCACADAVVTGRE